MRSTSKRYGVNLMQEKSKNTRLDYALAKRFLDISINALRMQTAFLSQMMTYIKNWGSGYLFLS